MGEYHEMDFGSLILHLFFRVGIRERRSLLVMLNYFLLFQAVLAQIPQWE